MDLRNIIKSKKTRDLEAEIQADNSDLNPYSDSTRTKIGRYLVPTISRGVIAPILIAKGIDTALSSLNKNIKNSTLSDENSSTYKNLIKKLGKKYGGQSFFGAGYDPVNDIVYDGIGGQQNSRTLAHEMGHQSVQHDNGSISNLLQRARGNKYIDYAGKGIAAINSIDAGYRLANDKILGKKSSAFNRFRGGAGALLLTQAPTLGSEAAASIRGYKIFKDAGGNWETGNYKKQMAKAFGTYALGAAFWTSMGWLMANVVKRLGIANYKNLSEVEKVAYISNLLRKDKQYKGMSTKELTKIAYDRMKVLDEELVNDSKGWKTALLR